MKRTVITLALVAIICSVGFAEEKVSSEKAFANEKYRFASGGFWNCGQDYCGGLGEFGINLLSDEKIFVLRDCIFMQGEGGTLRKNNSDNPGSVEYGALKIGDKLIIGGRTDVNGFIVRSYGFTGASMGFFKCNEHGFISQPFMLDVSFGGGFEFQYSKNTAFVIEFGGLNRFFFGNEKATFEGYSKSNPVLTIGYRTFNLNCKKES